MIKFLMNSIKHSRKIIQVKITDMKYIHNDKQLVFGIDNPGLLSHKALVKSIFKALKANKEFKAFGRRKTVIIQAMIDGEDRSFHQNILVNNQTTFKKYWSVVKDLITHNYEDGYPLEVINQFKVRIWNMNDVSNKKIKLTQNAMYIRPKTIKSITSSSSIKKVGKDLSRSNKRSYSTIKAVNINKTHITPLITPKALNLKPLDPSLLTKEIGKFKDELKGKTIQKVIFLGPKRYGYWFYDENNHRIEKSVYAGVERDSLTFNQIKKLYKK